MNTASVSLPVLCLTLAACAPMPPADAPTGWQGTPELTPDSYMMRDVAGLGLTGAEMLPEAASVIRAQLGGPGPVNGADTETLSVYENPPRGAVVLTLTRLADDAISAQQHLVEFDLRPDPQVERRVFAMPTGYGMRQKCARGSDPEAWTNRPCP